MHPTLRWAAVQSVNVIKRPLPLRQIINEAVLLNSFATRASVISDPALRHPGTAVKGCSTECTSVFTMTPFEIFEGNNKQAWIDLRQGYCHLCQEPVGTNAGLHISDRDHTNMQFFLFLYTAYPRWDFLAEARAAGTAGEKASLFPSTLRKGGEALQGRSSPPTCSAASAHAPASSPTAAVAPCDAQAVDFLQQANDSGNCKSASPLHSGYRHNPQSTPLWRPDDVLNGIGALSPSLCRFAMDHRTTDQLHTVDDAARRSELEALIFYLTHPPHQALPHVLQGKSPYGFWYSGERMWKYEMTRLISQIFPPLSAGMMTNFTQKCWGRSNEERLYDALRLQRIKSYYGWGPYESKEKKSFFLRQLIFELLLSEVRPELSETAKLLAAQAVRRMAFELIFLLSMDYMHRVQRVHELLGRPTLADLKALNLL
ncbi:hypothetical protein ABL78_1545 [Leptomonas seymouri]|uniref:Uncharacterized protein n=1 Tax=Leptomonas seymouri TaxID=5684 RepID=A0A0N0P7Y6_LEPSE|nr:hypothetical protein ABL78_1545 [Leptomonas seymouri]|eukprot:KPI89316.1 hypothetical protein ABL78_1545 [Leptomonas seymouri]